MSPSNDQEQTVYRLTKTDKINHIAARREPIPTPNRHEVLIKIKALALNYRDVAVMNNTYPFPISDNVVPISDSAGVIESLGEEVDGFKVGDRVIVVFDGTNQYGPQRDWTHGHGAPVDGFLREYAAVPAHMVIKVPESSKLSFSELASLVCTGVTSWNALFGSGNIRPGQTVLAQGTGGVSMTTLILAKAFGCKVIITSSSDDKLELAKKFGADETINYKTTPDWGKRAIELNGDVGVDLVIENGGAGTISQSLDSLKMGGEIAVIGFLSKPEGDMPDVTSMILGKGATVRGITVGSKQLLEECVDFVSVKELRIPVDKTFPFKDALKAYEFLQAGSHVGKICIEM